LPLAEKRQHGTKGTVISRADIARWDSKRYRSSAKPCQHIKIISVVLRCLLSPQGSGKKAEVLSIFFPPSLSTPASIIGAYPFAAKGCAETGFS
jgi:hypothetical protein